MRAGYYTKETKEMYLSTVHNSRPSTPGLAVKNKRSGWGANKGAMKLALKKPGAPLQYPLHKSKTMVVPEGVPSVRHNS